MMFTPGLQIYLRLRVTLTFDLLTPRVSCPIPEDHLWQLVSKSVHSFSKYRVHKFCDRRTDGRTNERTGWSRTRCLRLPVWTGKDTKSNEPERSVCSVDRCPHCQLECAIYHDSSQTLRYHGNHSQ